MKNLSLLWINKFNKMKAFLSVLLALTLSCLAGCKKDSGAEVPNIVYKQTIAGIKKNEPVLLTFNSGNSNATVSWAITPSAHTNVSAVGNNATITFSASGTYVVLATAGEVSAEYTVSVTNEEYDPYGTSFSMSAAKLINIAQGEPVVFTVHNPHPGSSIAWSVYSSGYILSTDTTNNTATIIFNNSGFGSVTASDGFVSQRRTVWINDALTGNPAEDTVPFILGEKLRLTPSVETVTGVKRLVISASTTNSYNCNTDKILSFSLNNEYMIDYSGVAMSTQPCSERGAATCSNSFTNIPAGTHPFTINLENKTYTGTLTVSSSGVYIFTWPDASAVTISPLQVQ